MAPFPHPAHRTGRALFTHQMWSTTFDAKCGVGSYVAPGDSCLRRPAAERHINFCLQRSQELQDVGVGAPPLDWRLVGSDLALGERARLPLQVDFGVHVGGLERGVT